MTPHHAPKTPQSLLDQAGGHQREPSASSLPQQAAGGSAEPVAQGMGDAVLLDLAQRLARLPHEKRLTFRKALRAKGIDDATLPIVPQLPMQAHAPEGHGDRQDAHWPLSFAQQRLWFLHELERDTLAGDAGQSAGAYHIATAFILRGPLDEAALARAFDALSSRHAALRTAIVNQDGQGTQRVQGRVALPLRTNDLRALTESDRLAAVQALADQLAAEPFDLSCAPLWRVTLCRTADDEHVLILVMHHIISDGWSMGVLMSDFAALYAAHAGADANPPALPPLPIQAMDHAAWQLERLQGDALDKQLTFWRDKLGTEHPVLSLPADHARPARQDLRGATWAWQLPMATATALRQLARQEGVTLFAVLCAGFSLLLSRLSGQQDIRVGTPVANRQRAETHGLVGLLANTVVLRSFIDGKTDFRGLVRAAQQSVAQAQAHQDLPFERLVDALAPERDPSHTPLFQAMLVVHEPSAPLSLAGLDIEPLSMARDTAKLDLTLEVAQEADGGLSCVFHHATSLFEPGTVVRWSNHLCVLLGEAARHPDQPLERLPLLTSDERRALIEAWNDTHLAHPFAGWPHQLFEAQVAARPWAPALRRGEEVLSRAELNERANRLAHWLREGGVGADSVVAVLMDRSIEMVVALLGIQKAGAAYLPLDPEHPPARLREMAEDAGVPVLLHHAPTALVCEAMALPPSIRTAALDDPHAGIGLYAGTNPDVAVSGAHLAYVIYTSGSTGRPKGVGVPHAGLLNRLQWMQRHLALSGQDKVLQKTPYTFDVSVWEFFWPLMVGAELVMAEPGDHKDPERLVALIERFGITTLHFVPSMLAAFLAHLADASPSLAGATASLRRVICSGEALSAEHQQRFFQLVPSPACELHNLYGPTEASIDVTAWRCEPVEGGAQPAAVPIGRPIDNTQMYVLDAALEPVPVGVAGELYIGGIGLARGYVRRPGLTADRFVPDPFHGAAGQRLYKTGDLARWRADGAIDYLGRLDHQVKIRGLRIELGEIEARLAAHPNVGSCVVVAREDRPGDKRLVAYWVPSGQLQSPVDDEPALRQHLAQTLPDHMVPAAIVRLAAMPLSPNGKLDRRQLPAPPQSPSRGDDGQAVAMTDAEQRLAQAWREVLGLAHVSPADNFFRIGGDSIMSLQVVARARRLGLRITPRMMFEQQTLGELAAVVQVLPGVVLSPDPASLPDMDEHGPMPLTPIQHWFFEAGMRHPHQWNQAVMLTPRQPLDPAMLAEATRRLAVWHPALRQRFEAGPSHTAWQAVIRPADEAVQAFAFEAIDLSAHAPENALAQMALQAERTQASLDIAQGPLARALHVRLPSGEGERLLLVVHHLVIDGVSWRILIEDLAQLCQAADAELSTPSLHPRRWAQALVEAAGSQRWDEEKAHWLGLADGVAGPGAHSRGKPGGTACTPEECVGNVTKTRVALDAERTEALLTRLPRILRTEVNDLLLTALARALCQVGKHEAVLIELEGHGREEVHDGVDPSRAVGWFTSRYPVRLAPGLGDPVASLKQIKEQLRQVPGKGMGHGMLCHLGPAEAREALRALPQPQVSFNYLGRFDQVFREDALFSLAQEATGLTRHPQERRTHALEIDGLVMAGALTFDCAGAAGAELAPRFLAELSALVDALAHAQPSATPSDFPLAGLTQADLDGLALHWPDVEDLYPLTAMQRGLLLETALHPGQGLYVIQERHALSGQIDADAFAVAWDAVAARHAILRTAFLGLDGEQPLQVVRSTARPPLTMHDWRGQSEAEQDAGLERLLAQDRMQAEAQAQGREDSASLFRLYLIRLGDRRHEFALCTHHAMVDAWSFPLLFADFLTAYRQACAGTEPGLPPSRPYRAFVAWQLAQDRNASEAYWRAALGGLNESCELRAAVPMQSAGLANARSAPSLADPPQEDLPTATWSFSETESHRLAQTAQAAGLTVNTLAQGAWAWLLSTLTGRRDVTFGITTSGRPADLAGAETIAGLFIATVPLRLQVPRQGILSEWLRAVQRQNAELREHEHLPLSRIQSLSPLGAGRAVFDTLLVFENTPVDERMGTADLGFRIEGHQGRTQTSFPLTVGLTPGRRLRLEIGHDPACFDAACVEGLGLRLRSLLLSMADGLDRAMSDWAADSLREDTIWARWGQGPRAAMPKLGVAQMIDQFAGRHPHRTAVIADGQTLSYVELVSKADTLARRISVAIAHARGVADVPPEAVRQRDPREARVGLCLPRSPLSLVAMLAVMKSGAAYVVLDAALPVARLQDIAAEAGLTLLMGAASTAELCRTLAAPHCDLLLADEVGEMNEAGLPPLRTAAPHPAQLAYLIYTSGSTGRPKGVGVSHGALAAHVQAMRDVLRLHPGDRVLQFGTLAFDAAIDQVFPALTSGASIVMRGEALWDNEELLAKLFQHGVTVADFSTSHWAQLCQSVRRAGLALPATLRHVTVGGEAMPTHALQTWHELGAGSETRLLNAYGPTEATVTATAMDCTLSQMAHGAGERTHDVVPIGLPLAGRHVHVLDGHLDPLPPGLAGELFIGGELLARGYLGQPALTASRFVPDPFGPTGARLYRTGDRARWRRDGVLEFLGRHDDQVKVRGHRVELAEIEAALRSLPGVEAAVAVVKGAADDRRLLGYVVCSQDERVRQAGQITMPWRDALADLLPAYMVPSAVIELDALPLAPSGKVDKAALPLPMLPSDASADAAPMGEAEQALAQVMRRVLGLPFIGREQGFFELGGDSIRALQVISRLRQAGWRLSVKDLFQHQRIDRLAGILARDEAHALKGDAESDLAPQGEVPLTPIQRWFFDLSLPVAHHWNQAVLLRRHGVPLSNAGMERLGQAWQAVVRHHDALNLRFERAALERNEQAAAWRQWHAPEAAAAPLLRIDLGAVAANELAEALAQACNRVQASMDLSHGPLVAAALLALPDGSQRLLLTAHHLVIDAVSWRILLDDLALADRQLEQGGGVQLPPKSASYQSWARYQMSLAGAQALAEEVAYWTRHLGHGAVPATAPSAACVAATEASPQRLELAFTPEITTALLRQAPAAYRTQVNDLLLAALAWALTDGADQASSALIEMEGHGREALAADAPDVSRTVGWFTSRHPLRLSRGRDLVDTLKMVKEHLRAVPRKGMGWGLLGLCDNEAVRAAVAALPVPRISFNYLGQLDALPDAAVQEARQQKDAWTWVLADESTGAASSPLNPRTHALEIDGAVVDGRLQWSWTFMPGQAGIDRPRVAAWMASFQDALCSLVDYCAQGPQGATPSDFPLAALTQAELDVLPWSQVEDIYPLTALQQGMLFHALCRQGGDVYVNQLHAIVRGTLDLQALREAWQGASDRHAMLRTGMLWQRHGEPVQIVHRQAAMPWTVLDWRHLDEARHTARLADFLEADRREGINLSRPPLMRLQIIQRHDGAHDLVWTSHHLLLDGASSARLLDEVGRRYADAVAGRQRSWPQAALFREHVQWTRQQPAEAARAHWQACVAPLSGPLMLAELIGERGGATRESQAGAPGHAEQLLTLDPTLTRSLERLAREQRVTLSALVMAAWALVLSRYSGRRDLVFGLTLDARPPERADMAQTLGLFINTLPMVCQLAPSDTLSDALAQVQRTLASQWTHPHTPLADVQRLASSRSDAALFDTLVVVENTASASQETTDTNGDDAAHASGWSSAGLHMEVVGRTDRTSYPLTLNLHPGQALRIEFSHDTTRFDPVTITQLADHMAALLRAMDSDPTQRLADLDLLTDGERAMRTAWNDTGDGRDLPHDCFALFAEQARRTPDAVAARCGAESIRYGELLRQALDAGRALSRAGVKPDDVVALHEPRGITLLAMIMAVFAAGAAYLPLEPGHPRSRRLQILSRSACRWAMSGAKGWDELQALLAGDAVDVPVTVPLSFDALLNDEGCEARDASWVPVPGHSQGLAYVIFTSGSTGTPKGAMVDRRGMMNNLLQKHVQLGMGAGDVIAQTAPASFDISVWQFLSGLLCGATIEIVPDEVIQDPAALLSRLAERRVTVFETVPSLMRVLLDERHPGGSLRWMLPTGEALPPSLARQWLERHPDVPLLNVYGPAECADDVSVHVIDAPPDQDCRDLPIGRPVPHLRLHVLDAALQPVPVGVAGELCIAGVGVGRGYLMDPGRTAASFVPDPFARDPGERLYRTGDLVRQQADGVLVYLGRIDHQVKLRGLRIELGEIEAALVAQPGVGQAVVVRREQADGQATLAAFVSPEETWTPPLDTAALAVALAERLPAYMVPSHMRALASLPLNANGKVDRKTLMSMPLEGGGFGVSSTRGMYVPAATATEALLENIWCDVLQAERIGVHENFFALGGHSLLAMRVMQRVRQLSSPALPLTLIFQSPTIASMALALGRNSMGDAGAPVSPLVTLHEASSQNQRCLPLFCVHPAGGHVASYLPLAGALGGGQAVFGLQSRSLGDPGWRDESIGQMARDYVNAMRERQPCGPYRLLGWSMGGTIALAMAAELESQGEAVQWVGLLDTLRTPAADGRASADGVMGEDGEWWRECLGYIENAAGQVLPDGWQQEAVRSVGTLDATQRLAALLRWTQSKDWLPGALDVEQIQVRLDARLASSRLLREHRVSAIQAPVHVWQARATLKEDGAAALDWTGISPDVRHAVVEGDHLAIVSSPSVVEALTRLLSEP